MMTFEKAAKVLFVLSSINLIDTINMSLLTPYVDKMVSRFLGSDSDDPHVLWTVGLLVGSYSCDCDLFCI